jgi:flap endonuclease-1
MAIRELYLKPPANRGISPGWRPVDRERVVSYLVGEHSFSRERVETALDRLQSKAPEETLEKWFG